MRIQIKLFADLRRYLPDGEPSVSAEFPDGASIAEVLQSYGVPEEKPRIILVNGRHAPITQALQDGDLLSVFPPVAGG